MLVPLTGNLSLATGFVYLIPEQEGTIGVEEESWSLGITLVWTPGRSKCNGCGQVRSISPLFDVADNGTFLVDRVR